MIRLTVVGAAGRMGRCLMNLASGDSRFEMTAAIDRTGSRTLPPCDVLIDFTDAEGTIEWLERCTTERIPMVIGATGHDQSKGGRIEKAARAIPIVKAANFSIGIQTILDVVGHLAARLGDEYDIEIVEAHHRHKIDAPSGTALAMADVIQKSIDQNRDREEVGPIKAGQKRRRQGAGNVIFGRYGRIGERPRGEIGVHAVRMGDIVGQHEIHFSGAGETITIRHTAHSRDTFAAGALRAAAWVVGKPPGLYSMRNVLNAE